MNAPANQAPLLSEEPTLPDLSTIRALVLPDPALVARGPAASVRMAQSFVVTDADDYQMAAIELQNVKAAWNRLDAQRTSLTEPLNKVVKGINDLFLAPLAALKQAEELFKKSMLAYSDEQERQAKQRKAEAERAAEVERKRLADEAERIAAEARARQKAIDDAAAQVAAAAKAEQERIAKVAADAKAAGDAAALAQADAEAKKVREAAAASAAESMRQAEAAAQTAASETAALQLTAAVTTVPIAAVHMPTAAGTSTSKSIEFEVHSFELLVKHVAANLSLLNLLHVDEVRLRAYTKGLGLACNLPGVTVREKTKMSSRSA